MQQLVEGMLAYARLSDQGVPFTPVDLEELVRVNEKVFDDIEPFTEIVLWNLGNEEAMSITPTLGRTALGKA